MMVQYLLDTDAEVRSPAWRRRRAVFGDVVAPIALALEQEKRVTEQINALAGVARAENDFTSEQFMQWFIKEQVEEVATMSDLLRVAERSRDDVHEIEDYVAREQSAARAPTRRRRGRGGARERASRPGSAGRRAQHALVAARRSVRRSASKCSSSACT